MRRVVVLPAPLGPSRPVIWPSAASKWTPSTALTVPVLVLNVLCRLSAEIMRRSLRRGSWRPAVEVHERRHVAQRVEAAGIERGGVGAFDERAKTARAGSGRGAVCG